MWSKEYNRFEKNPIAESVNNASFGIDYKFDRRFKKLSLRSLDFLFKHKNITLLDPSFLPHFH